MLFIFALLFSSITTAFQLPDWTPILPLIPRKNSSNAVARCPTVWNDISKTLTTKFLSDGQCNSDARAAIRLVFHESGAWNKAQGAHGGCDGSIILGGELDRDENKGLAPVSQYIHDLAIKHNVGIADLIVFAGNHAIVTCPGGPRVKTYIGRKDSSVPAPNGLLPDVHAPAAELYQLFQDKGLNSEDLAALLGAHSTSQQFNFNTSAGAVGYPQDSTPGVWDVKYYKETLYPIKGVVVFPSDTKLAAHPQVGKQFKGFVNNQGKWNGKFASAMAKMTLFGNDGTVGLVDCTDALPHATGVKREMRALPLFAKRD